MILNQTKFHEVLWKMAKQNMKIINFYLHVKVLAKCNFLYFRHIRNKMIDHIWKQRRTIYSLSSYSSGKWLHNTWRVKSAASWTAAVIKSTAVSKIQRKHATLAPRMVCILFRTSAAAAAAASPSASYYIIYRMMSCPWAHTDASCRTARHHTNSHRLLPPGKRP